MKLQYCQLQSRDIYTGGGLTPGNFRRNETEIALRAARLQQATPVLFLASCFQLFLTNPTSLCAHGG